MYSVEILTHWFWWFWLWFWLNLLNWTILSFLLFRWCSIWSNRYFLICPSNKFICRFWFFQNSFTLSFLFTFWWLLFLFAFILFLWTLLKCLFFFFRWYIFSLRFYCRFNFLFSINLNLYLSTSSFWECLNHLIILCA